VFDINFIEVVYLMFYENVKVPRGQVVQKVVCFKSILK